MAWNLSGQLLEACSCQQTCPCNFGPAAPDQGWCSGAIALDIQQGTSDGVSLVGTKAVMVVDFPHDFAGGNGTLRLYIDDRANTNQRRELEAVLSGKKGGPFAAISGLITKAMPTEYTKIDVKAGDKVSVKVGNVGEVHLAKIKDEDGRQAKLENPPAFRAFGLSNMELAFGTGSYWTDPQMRRWVGGGAGSASPFSMKS